MKRKLVDIFDFSRSSEAVVTLLFEMFLGLVAVLSSIYVFLALADEVLEKETFFFDSIISNLVTAFRTPFMTEVMLVVTFLGGNYFLALAIITTILLLWKKHRKDAIMFSFIFFSAVGLNLILKEIFQRPRPDEPLIIESLYSFPSGHAMNSFVFYAALTYFVFRHMKNRKLGMLFSFLAGLLVLLIGISRVYLGVHYASDVIAGFLAGLCWMGVVILIEKTVLFFRLFREFENKKEY
ncbi:MAG: phosphatase PAP2 family protein [Candidatus Levybacteria bacterium]|nr:phosphatase PAP2 family protein [Candidatus Levybacteria bacterium]